MKMTILGQLPKTLRPENSRIELGEVAIQLLPFHWTQQSSQNDIALKSHYLRKALVPTTQKPPKQDGGVRFVQQLNSSSSDCHD